MKLKMNRSRSRGHPSTKTKSNGIMKSSSLPLAVNAVKIKEEKQTFSDEEFASCLPLDNTAMFKVEMEEEDSFISQEQGLHSFDANSSASSSGHSSASPSPSPPPTHPQVRDKPPHTALGLGKTSPSLIVSPLGAAGKGLATGGAGGGSVQYILIDNRGYQLIPHHQAPAEPSPLQVRVLPQQKETNPQRTTKSLSWLPPQPQLVELKASSSTVLSATPATARQSPSPLTPHKGPHTSENKKRSRGTDHRGAPLREEAYHFLEGGYSPHRDPHLPQENGGGEGEGEDEYGGVHSPPEGERKEEIESSQSSSQETSFHGNDTDCLIPNLLNDCGPFGFKIHLDAKEDTLKTPTWLVSSITNKLYTNMNKPIPFRVVLKKPPNKKRFFLRAMAVFKYPMFLRQNVVRCPNHLNPVDSTNIDFSHPEHVIRADHPRAGYETSASGRLSVVVPLDFPENRVEALPVLLKFMCHNSCVGGINRRPMAVLLTLEHNDEESGRYTVDVRVCACPSRDVKTEEKQVIAKGLYKKTGHVFDARRNRKRQRKDGEYSNGAGEDDIYYLPVRGLLLFNFLQDTKAQYLKHHQDYATKYPDPPLDLSLKMLEELHNPPSEAGLHVNETPPLVAETPPPVVETPPPATETPPLVSESPPPRQRGSNQSLFVVCGNEVTSEKRHASRVLTESALRRSMSAEVTSSLVKIKKEANALPISSHSDDERLPHFLFGGPYVAASCSSTHEPEYERGGVVAASNSPPQYTPQPSKAWRKKGVSNSNSSSSSFSGKVANGRHRHRKLEASVHKASHQHHYPAQPQSHHTVKRVNHLQVASMPEKEKGTSVLTTYLPKEQVTADTASREERSTSNSSKLQIALEGGAGCTSNDINENDKVMLAAHVLASHMGAHQIDK